MTSKLERLSKRVKALEGDAVDKEHEEVITVWMDEDGEIKSTREILTKEEHATRYPDHDPRQPITVNWDVNPNEDETK